MPQDEPPIAHRASRRDVNMPQACLDASSSISFRRLASMHEPQFPFSYLISTLFPWYTAAGIASRSTLRQISAALRPCRGS